jgi:hypothetical protein
LPVAEIVPRAEEPLGVLLTDQETEEFEVPVTLAEKVTEEPARMLAVEGDTTTAMVGVGFGVGVGVFGVEEVPPPELQEERKRASRKKAGKTWRDIVRSVCGRQSSKDNCTAVQKRSKEAEEKGFTTEGTE